MLNEGENFIKEKVDDDDDDDKSDKYDEASSNSSISQDVVAISFKKEETKNEVSDFDIQGTLKKWLETDETDLNVLIKNGLSELKSSNNLNFIKVENHLNFLKNLAVNLYFNNNKNGINSKFEDLNFSNNEKMYLWFMTTVNDKITELDGVLLRHFYLENFTWKSDLLVSLRILCLKLFFKGESQNIDTMIHSFANNWYTRYNQPSFIYGNIVGVYLVTYSLILLNTDLHSDDHSSNPNSYINESQSSSNHTNRQSLNNNNNNNNVSSISMARRRSGSHLELVSYDTTVSSLNDYTGESNSRKSQSQSQSYSYSQSNAHSSYSKHEPISKNQFVLNTISAINDNFVIINPLIIRKQLRLYYTNIKNNEIKLPNINLNDNILKMDENIISNKNNSNNTSNITTVDDAVNKGYYETIEGNDELCELKTIEKRNSHQSLSSCVSRISFELVSGKFKESEGTFGFLKEIENNKELFLSKEEIETGENLEKDNSYQIKEVPYVKEGLQRILCKREIDDYNNFEIDDIFDSSNFIFRDIPNKLPKLKLIEHIKGKKKYNMNEEKFIVISEGELRIFDFNKSPEKLNSRDKGKGEWNKFARCLGIVNLSGCYAEILGENTRRRVSNFENQRLKELFNNKEDKYYWKLELPYSMMNDNDCVDLSSKEDLSTYKKYGQIYEKLIFVANTKETAKEFVNSCNYWSSRMTPVPPKHIFDIFSDCSNSLTSEEYGFSKKAQDLLDGKKIREFNRLNVVKWHPPIQSTTTADSTKGISSKQLVEEHLEVLGALFSASYSRYRVHRHYNERSVALFAVREIWRWRAYREAFEGESCS